MERGGAGLGWLGVGWGEVGGDTTMSSAALAALPTAGASMGEAAAKQPKRTCVLISKVCRIARRAHSLLTPPGTAWRLWYRWRRARPGEARRGGVA